MWRGHSCPRPLTLILILSLIFELLLGAPPPQIFHFVDVTPGPRNALPSVRCVVWIGSWGAIPTTVEVNMLARKVSVRLKPNMLGTFASLIEREILPWLRKQEGFLDLIILALPDG